MKHKLRKNQASLTVDEEQKIVLFITIVIIHIIITIITICSI